MEINANRKNKKYSIVLYAMQIVLIIIYSVIMSKFLKCEDNIINTLNTMSTLVVGVIVGNQIYNISDVVDAKIYLFVFINAIIIMVLSVYTDVAGNDYFVIAIRLLVASSAVSIFKSKTTKRLKNKEFMGFVF